MSRLGRAAGAVLLLLPVVVQTQDAAPQTTNDPFPAPIEATQGIVAVNAKAFATLPDEAGTAPRMMTMVDEPASKRYFVSSMTGLLYAISHDSATVRPYLDINDAGWNVPVQSRGSERGLQSFAFHPQFAERGTPGYGKIYTYVDTSDMAPTPDVGPFGDRHSHDTVLLEWTAKDPLAASYDGGAPRPLLRVGQPYSNHNGGQLAFNPLARSGAADYGLLYVGLADGGSGGDPFNQAQDLSSAFGKILRIDPLGKDGGNGQYGIPASNPFVSKADARPEIYALGVRNPQRFSWDAKTGTMFVADIGQNLVEEVSPVTAGANLGWNVWEASFRFMNRAVGTGDPRSDAAMTYPVVEFDHSDPLLQNQVAVTGVYVYRGTAVPQLANLLVFGDNPSGELFYVNADALPDGGQSAIRRILFNDDGGRKTLLELIQATNAARGQTPARRADLRLGMSADGQQVFLLNKHDGVVRVIVP
jgi:Glucose / Sorbosone dehydrogenase